MPKRLSGSLVVTLSIAPSYEYLHSEAEAETYHIYGYIKDTGKGGCAQFHLTNSSKEDGISHTYQLFHHQTDHDRQGHPENVPV